MKISSFAENNGHQNFLESINPNHQNFDFNLWASVVRGQMVTILQKRLSSELLENNCHLEKWR
jgi:hypothetical protein